MNFDADILVLGGGSVGLAATAALAQAGFAVCLLERGGAPVAVAAALCAEVDQRVYALSPGSLNFLAGLGAGAGVKARAAPYQGMQVWQADAAKALAFSAPFGQSLGAIVEHRVLNASLAALPECRDQHFGAQVQGLTADEGAAAVQLTDGRVLHAKLLVIADGADSPWPSQLGLTALTWGYPQRAIVCHAQTQLAHGQQARQRFLDTGPLALLPLADGRVSVVWSCEAALSEELLALSDDAFALRLASASQYVLGPVASIGPRLSFALKWKRLSPVVCAGAVVLGDAAHVLHPMAGQGVNLGLADARVLAQTLAAAKAAGRSWWCSRSLEHYARQRAPEVDEMLALTEMLHRAFSQSGSGLAAMLGQGMAGLNQLPLARDWLAQQAMR